MIHTRSPLRPAPKSRGFTIIELLVVIGIIVILVGILIPVVSRVKIAGYTAATQQEISQLSTAINQYYAQFHAYPGPFSNDQIEGLAPAPLFPIKMNLFDTSLVPPAWQTTQTPYNVTGTENLVLGLLGGLNRDSGGAIGFNPTEVGLGPLSLNTANPRRYSSFLGNNYLVWCSGTSATMGPYSQSTQIPGKTNLLANFVDQSGVVQANDSLIPEFVDAFPTPGPMPILYLRARSGAQGIVSNSSINPPYQYDLRDINGYTAANPNTGPSMGMSIGLPVRYLPSPWPANTHYQHNLIKVDTSGSYAPPNLPPTVSVASGADIRFQAPFNQITLSGTNQPDTGTYFNNPAISPAIPSTVSPVTDAAINQYGRPRAVDQFILISAGPDGIYGTSDDITSFGDVTAQ